MRHVRSWPRSRSAARLAGLIAALVLLGVPACRVTDLVLWRPQEPAPGKTFEVECLRDITYYKGPGADAHRHLLDLFLPKGQKDYPVVVLVHGGAWIMGDNRCCGLYSAVGEFLARQGIGVALPNYRLSPGVKHPEHIKDVARAFAWVKAHVSEHGGRPDQLFLAGHSAGGHLVALLASDDRYLKAEGMTLADIRGVIAFNGVYRIPPGRFSATLGGDSDLAFHFDELMPFRCLTTHPRFVLPGIPLRLNVFGPAFGDDPQVRADASPINHVRPGLPPFLLICGDNDLPTLADMAEEFYTALLQQGDEAHLLRVEGRNHNSALFRLSEPGDPVAQAVLEFIHRHIGDPL
jgi:acetyl esterase/lipase